MRSTLIAANGDRFNILPLPQQQAVMLWSHDKASGKIHQLVVPVDMMGAFTQAAEAAAKVAYREKNGPGTERAIPLLTDAEAEVVARSGVLRCLDADACKAGQVECPHFHLCCAGAGL
ncbi:hypothetical protein [Polaromonas sp. YR568]|uniref:hypothetical protein n=1 Tax=Polaromonas sp. YR568 TaxID=1855301 RepID=UPI003138428F